MYFIINVFREKDGWTILAWNRVNCTGSVVIPSSFTLRTLQHLWERGQTLLNRHNGADELPPVSLRSPSRQSLDRSGCTAASPALRWGRVRLRYGTEGWRHSHRPIAFWSWHTRNGLGQCWPWTLTLLHLYRPTAQSEATDQNQLYGHKTDSSAAGEYRAQKVWAERTCEEPEEGRSKESAAFINLS